MRFGIALVQGLKAFAEPGVEMKGTGWVFPILHPMKIVESVCVARDGSRLEPNREKVDGTVKEKCPNPTSYSLWYKLERDQGRFGWARASHVAVWNSRHALRPSTQAGAELVPGYCDEREAENSARGKSDPCMTFNRTILQAQGERAPFPVIDVKEFGDGVEFDMRKYFKVLVPTLYSMLPPVRGNAAMDKVFKAEFIILVDATKSMEQEIEGTKNALVQLVRDLKTKYRVDAKFVVLGFRDTDGSSAECPPMEGTTNAQGRLDFVSGEEAIEFLSSLSADCGGDPREAIWDAFYLLRDLVVEPGAQRILFLIGDTPSVEVTRGMTFGGVTVPRGLRSEQVLSKLADVFGESTRFNALLVKSGLMKKTVNEIMKGSRFFANNMQRVDQVSAKIIQAKVSDLFNVAAGSSGADVQAVSDCNNKFLSDDTSGAFGFFCSRKGNNLDSRIKDLLSEEGRTGDVVVIRELWVPATQALQDVALLTIDEARTMGQNLAQLSVQIGEDGSGCRKHGVSIWTETVKALVPVEDSKGSTTSAVVGKRLHDYWRLSVGGGSEGSIINYSPDQIASLDSDRCFAVRNRLYKASQRIEQTLQMQKKNQYIWLNFQNIP